MADLEADTDALITAERALADHGTMPLPLGPLAPIVAGAVLTPRHGGLLASV